MRLDLIIALLLDPQKFHQEAFGEHSEFLNQKRTQKGGTKMRRNSTAELMRIASDQFDPIKFIIDN